MAIDLSKPMSLHQQGRYAEALSLYDAALKQDQKTPTFYISPDCAVCKWARWNAAHGICVLSPSYNRAMQQPSMLSVKH